MEAMSVVEMVGATGAVVVAFTRSAVVVIGGRVDMPSVVSRDTERTRHRVAIEARYLMMAGRTRVSPNGKGRPFLYPNH